MVKNPTSKGNTALKRLLLATALTALAGSAHAADWWEIENDECELSTISPAQLYQAGKNKGFDVHIFEVDGAVMISAGPGASTTFFRTEHTCEATKKVFDALDAADAAKLDKYR